MGCFDCCKKDNKTGRRGRDPISAYYELLVRWPGLVLGVVLVIFVIIFIVISFNMEYLKVVDAAKGVEARETDLSGRSISLNHLLEYKDLSVVPTIDGVLADMPVHFPPTKASNCTPSNWFKMLKIIVEPIEEDGNLLDVKHLKSLCTIQSQLTQHKHVDKTCGMVSILDVVKEITGATCATLNQGHFDQINAAVSSCMAHYISGVVAGQPEFCPAIFKVFHFYSDSAFSSGTNNVGTIFPLRRTLVMILLNDIPTSEVARDYHADMLDKVSLTYDGVTQITGIDSALKPEVFERYLFLDMMWMVVAFLLVAVVIMIYLKSVVMAIVTAVNIGLSLTIAYFVYLIVFRIQFFPFLNLLSSVILIALAADDVFLFSETWQTMKKRFPRGSLEDNMTLTFRHAGMSVFVTSVTTATSFFSNYVSNVTSIKCFGVYAGLCIIANYFLMCTFIPAVMILLERNKCDTKCSKMESPKCFTKFYDTVTHASEYVFGKAFYYVINKFYFLLIFIFLALGVGSFIVVYYKPKLSLPDDGRFQGFRSSHPLEVYDDLIRSFKFVQDGDFRMPLYYVWGVEPVDNGNPINPDDYGKLVLDDTFNIEGSRNQHWIADVCKKLRDSKFVLPNNATVCSMELYLKSLDEQCVNADLRCCKNGDNNFRKCFPAFMAKLYAQTPVWNIAGLPFFDDQNQVKAFLVNFTAVQGYISDYEKMDSYYNNISSHLESILESNVPSGAGQVFLTSIFTFYDTQKALIRGTFESVGISLAVTLLCVLVTTRNILVSLYSIVNIAQAIHVTIASLVLLGWKLNVTESIIFSLAVGLTIDFVIHFGVSYMLSYEMTREKKVHEVLVTVGSPASMAAFTTFLAGAAMMPASVYCYQQLGIFLVFVMVISLAYSLFFFLPLCRWIGPLNGMLQIPLFCCKDSDKDKEKDLYSSNDTSVINSYNSTKSNSLEHSPRNSGKPSHNSSFTNIDSILHGSRRHLLDQSIPSISNFHDSQSQLYKEFYLSPDPLGSDKPYRPYSHTNENLHRNLLDYMHHQRQLANDQSSKHRSSDRPKRDRLQPPSERPRSSDRPRSAERPHSSDRHLNDRHRSSDRHLDDKHRSSDRHLSDRHHSSDRHLDDKHRSSDRNLSDRHRSSDRHLSDRHRSSDRQLSDRRPEDRPRSSDRFNEKHRSSDRPKSSERHHDLSDRHNSSDRNLSDRHERHHERKSRDRQRDKHRKNNSEDRKNNSQEENKQENKHKQHRSKQNGDKENNQNTPSIYVVPVHGNPYNI